MQKRREKIVLILVVGIIILLHIISWLLIKEYIPQERWLYKNTYHSRNVLLRLSNCFFGGIYFFLGYFFFERKNLYGCIEKKKEGQIEKWKKCAALCQMGIIFLYFFGWLNYTNEFMEPVKFPRRYFFAVMRAYLSSEVWFEVIGKYKCFFLWMIIMAPICVTLLLYLGNFISQYIKLRSASCVNKKWRNWNIVYTVLFMFMLFWAYDAQQDFFLLRKIPGFHVIFFFFTP